MDQNTTETQSKFSKAWKCPKYTMIDWYQGTKERQRNTEIQHQLAERILADSERLIEESSEDATKNRREVDHQLGVKIKDIEFTKEQLERQKKQMDLEIDALIAYKHRIETALKSLSANALDICHKCLSFRECRIGIDLCVDDAELEIIKETEIITGVNSLLMRTLEQVNEQIRRLRAQNYTLSRDLLDKANVLLIDKHNLLLNENSLNLSIYHGGSALDPATITEAEWSAHTQANIDAATKELNICIPLRAYIDAVLKQVIEDLWNQNDAVNEAFRRRIQEYKTEKSNLERSHFECVRQIDEMKTNILNLEKAIADKEKFMALAHTRLGNRAHRENVELCRDEAEVYLVDEVNRIRDAVINLQQMLAESNATLRYLLRTQIQLEEDINIKNNSIKIDEVDCMTLRRSIDYRSY
uniref:Tektin n=2 Tax=Triatoma infestans TaxID=30076 RepID=A0A023F9D9_TRIIF